MYCTVTAQFPRHETSPPSPHGAPAKRGAGARLEGSHCQPSCSCARSQARKQFFTLGFDMAATANHVTTHVKVTKDTQFHVEGSSTPLQTHLRDNSVPPLTVSRTIFLTLGSFSKAHHLRYSDPFNRVTDHMQHDVSNEPNGPELGRAVGLTVEGKLPGLSAL